MRSGNSVSIWFFIGISLLVNGALIFGTGIFELVHPPEYRVVLYELHADIWWGGLLLLAGILYCYRFAPRKAARSTPDSTAEKVNVR
jgi:hypothetical protein